MFNKFVVAYDHRVNQKYIELIKKIFNENNIEYFVIDDFEEANDYPILAQEAYKKYLEENADAMLLLCGTGIGMNVMANKCDGIRSVLATSEAIAYFARRHEDANCLVFGAGYADGVYEVKMSEKKLAKMLNLFLTTNYEGGRHDRRLSQIIKFESEN